VDWLVQLKWNTEGGKKCLRDEIAESWQKEYNTNEGAYEEEDE